MNTNTNHPACQESSKPPSACGGCPQEHACREVWGADRRGPFNPVGLTLGSAAAFILPLLTAIVAGGIVHERYPAEKGAIPIWEILAAAGGLAVGVVLGWVLVPIIKKRFRTQTPSRKSS